MKDYHVFCSDAKDICETLERIFSTHNKPETKTVIIEVEYGSTIVCNLCDSKCLQQKGDSFFPRIPYNWQVILRGNRSEFIRCNTKINSESVTLFSPAFRFFHVEGTLVVRECSFQGGYAKARNGGAIYVKQGTFRAIKCTFVHCLATGKHGTEGNSRLCGNGGSAGLGGAIFSYSSNIVLDECELRENCCIGGDGGSIENPTAYVSLKDCRIPELEADNHLYGIGGEGYNSSQLHRDGSFPGGGGAGGTGLIRAGIGSIFGGNGGLGFGESPAAGGGGGALGGGICACKGNLKVRRCIFRENRCSAGKGGVHAWGHSSGTSGVSCGGGIFFQCDGDKSSCKIENAIFQENYAERNQEVYDSYREKECDLAPKLLTKAPLKTYAVSLFGNRTGRPLPSFIVKAILQEYVGWHL